MQHVVDFLVNNYNYALAVQKAFNIHPLITLSQLAFECDWGRGPFVKSANNYASITAYGKTNMYWNGEYVYNLRKTLKFRKYTSAQNSFLDFGRLIKEAYPTVHAKANNLYAYAEAISKSKYIDEKNGDNREAYKKGIINIGELIVSVVQKKNLNLDLLLKVPV